MSELLPFVKCESPFSVKWRDTTQLVPCGHCTPCLNRQRDALKLKLRIEEQSARYCWFITLTYDNDNLPLFNMICRGNKLFARAITSRVRDRMNQRSLYRGDKDISIERYFNEMPHYITDPYRVFDKELDCMTVDPIRFRSEFILPSMRDYERQVQNYDYFREVQCLKTHKVFKESVYGRDSTFALLFHDDLQLWMKRLRKKFKDYFDEEVRFYAIGEYGSKSLRPHWHCLLFFNSFEANEMFSNYFTTFEELEDGKNTCPKFLLPLWKFGFCTAVRTDKSAFSYVSGYVNQSHDFPVCVKLLCPQKAYHSNNLGSSIQKEEIADVIKSKDFESFTKRHFINYYGIECDYSLWRSLYTKIFPRLPFVDHFSIDQIFDLYTSFDKFKLVGSEKVTEISAYIVNVFRGWFKPLPKFMNLIRLFEPLYLLGQQTRDLYGPIERVLYESKRFCKLCIEYELSYDVFYNLCYSFYSWIDSRSLKNHLCYCECQPRYAKLYYSILSGDMSYLDSSEFYNFRSNEFSKYDKNIKHRAQIAMVQSMSNLNIM